jgi:glutamate N-acetyltransferase/amino-acid N-acetyltransferase
MKLIEGGICAPGGFLAAGIYSGIKRNSNSRDLAVIFSEVPAVAAGVFTSNKVKADCVVVSEAHLKDDKARAIVVNSGNANCCAGPQGLKDARQMAQVTARALDIDRTEVLVASTGVIGKPLPMEKIINGIPQLTKRLSIDNSREVAEAIMTTDTAKKEIAARFNVGGKNVTIGAVAKGSGMICPSMATMLCFITTDIAIDGQALKLALGDCVDRTFNCISVDADMSTNDMVLILANGSAGNKKITLKAKNDLKKFTSALFEVTRSLAKMIAKDGEGATKLIEVLIKGAKSQMDARLAARALCNSPLFKTAIYGQDPNWGRVAAAVGASKADIDPAKLSIAFGNKSIFSKGRPVDFNEAGLKNILKNKEVKVTVELGSGAHSVTMWTCDLSEGYIRINAKYRT